MNTGLRGSTRRRLTAGIALLLGLAAPAQAGGGGGPDLRSLFQDRQLHLPGGGSLPMAAVLGHRPLILQFLTPPCRTCKPDDDLIRQQSFEYADQGVTLINIYGGHDQVAIQPFRKIIWIGVPDLTDADGTLARRAGVTRRHQLVFVSASGRVLSTLSGPFSPETVLHEVQALIRY